MRVPTGALVFMLWAASLSCTGFLVGAVVRGSLVDDVAHPASDPSDRARPLGEDAAASNGITLVQAGLWAGAMLSALAMAVLFFLLGRAVRRDRTVAVETRQRREMLRQIREYSRDRKLRQNN